jgi:hypothetical protein
MDTAATGVEWPSLERDAPWVGTHDYLHLVAQMLGKLRLSLAPMLPEWYHAPLSLFPRGLTTRMLPSGSRSVEATLDVFDGVVRLQTDDGSGHIVALTPPRPIAHVWSEYTAALAALGVEAALWDKPQERLDSTPFSADDRPRTYDAAAAGRWFALLAELHNIFDAWRSPFFGRTGVQFWWGGFDLNVALFTGREVEPPAGSNYIMRYDLDAEHLTGGFWPGDDEHEARFFGYVVPEPPGCDAYPLTIPSAAWAPALGEWTLSYESIRRERDRAQIVRAFLDTIYRAAGDLGGWNLDEFTYIKPPGRETSGRDVADPSHEATDAPHGRRHRTRT